MSFEVLADKRNVTGCAHLSIRKMVMPNLPLISPSSFGPKCRR